jgi:iron complex outermembrane receptor protein
MLKSGTALTGIGAALAGLASPAAAQAQDKTPPDETVTREIIVTGTLLRGAPPVGSSVIAQDETSIQASGATTSNEILAQIPQVSNLFNQTPSRRFSIAANQVQIVRPNLRSISADNASSASTLVLFDGYRVATAGVTQASIDPDLMPTAAIERVEVVTDGGSAIYGADAVGGVINFITRKRFDGVKVDARYGIADDYQNVDVNAIIGKDWGSGSAFIAYTFNKNDALFGRDREFITNKDFSNGQLTGVTCNNANITAGGVSYTGVGTTFAPGTTLCDTANDTNYVPRIERHGVFASLTQDLNESISITTRAFYSQRSTTGPSEYTVANLTVPSSNYYYIPLPAGSGSTARQMASFSLAPALGVDTIASGTNISEWGANAELHADISSNWQFRGLFNYSQSDSSSFTRGPNQALLNAAAAGTTAATAINPYNVAATNPALLSNIINNNSFAGQTRDELLNFKGTIDGTLIALPGGDLRLAAGYEFLHDTLRNRSTQNTPIGYLAGVPYQSYTRDVHAVFGELLIPVFGAENAVPGISSFVISAQGRYDHYSDFGGTFNPKFGATYKPVEWLSIRGNWSKSFNAPSPIDQLGANNNVIGTFPFVAFTRPGDNIGFFGGSTVALQGSQPNLKPQKAETWAVGFDADPPFIPGLHMNASYYNVVFKDQLRTPSPNTTIFANFPNNIQTSVTGISADTLRQFGQLAPNGSAIVEPLIANGTLVYEIVDFRTGNFGILKTDGIDFAVSYRHGTGFGGFDLMVAGNYTLNRKAQVSPTAAVIDELKTLMSDFRVKTTVGADIGALRAQASWNHTSGFDVERTNTLPQDQVKSFNTIDLFFKYDVPTDSKLLKDLSLTLNVNNMLDQDAPVFKQRGQGGFINGHGFTLGRQFIFGVSKKF